MEYQLANYLLNTQPRLLTLGAYELYKRGYVPKQIKTSDKVSKKQIYMINTVLKRIKEGKLNDIKNVSFYQLLASIIDEPKLIVFANYKNAITDIYIGLKKYSDSEYGNKFEYLRVKQAKQ